MCMACIPFCIPFSSTSLFIPFSLSPLTSVESFFGKEVSLSASQSASQSANSAWSVTSHPKEHLDLERQCVLLLQDAKQAQGMDHIVVGERSILEHVLPLRIQVVSCCDGGGGVVLLLAMLKSFLLVFLVV